MRDKHLYSYQETGLQSQCTTVFNCRLNLCSCHCNIMPSAIRSLTHLTGVRCLQNQLHSGGRGQELIHLHWCKSRLQTRRRWSWHMHWLLFQRGKLEVVSLSHCLGLAPMWPYCSMASKYSQDAQELSLYILFLLPFPKTFALSYCWKRILLLWLRTAFLHELKTLQHSYLNSLNVSPKSSATIEIECACNFKDANFVRTKELSVSEIWGSEGVCGAVAYVSRKA